MARLLTTGAEMGSVLGEGFTISAGTPTADTGNPRSGAFAFKFDSGAGNTLTNLNYSPSPAMSLARTYWLRAYMYYTGPPALDTFMVGFNSQITVYLKAAGVLVVRVSSATLQNTDKGSTSSALVAGNWYRIEISQIIRSGALDDDWEFRLDGVTVSSAVGESIGTSMVGSSIGFGYGTNAPGANYVTYLDDIALNDDQGASQNTWPGDGKQVLLKSVTDSASGTGWTLGTGTAVGTAVHTALANTPPLGVADLAAGSDTKQVRNATANANVNIDQNMTTYSAAGIVAADTINVIDPIVSTAAPVVTSAKAGTVGVVSNPAIANVALGAGGTAGAFWSGVAGGTYPTGWKTSHGTVTYGSTPTLGTAPVMRITQVTSSTRIADVCFMGIYVDYTPAVAARVPYTNPMPPLLAQ